jgi:HPt (histidine-containing phosphotransfer) domain-containing protein
MIDPVAIQNLVELENSESFYFVKELEDIFQEQTPRLIEQIMTGLENDNSQMIFSGAHTLKASCAYLGATEMMDLCDQIESWTQKKEKTRFELYPLVHALQNSYELSKSELHQIISDIGLDRRH